MLDYVITLDADESIISINKNIVSIYAIDNNGMEVLTRVVNVNEGDSYKLIAHYPMSIYAKNI